MYVVEVRYFLSAQISRKGDDSPTMNIRRAALLLDQDLGMLGVTSEDSDLLLGDTDVCGSFLHWTKTRDS